MGKGRCAHRSQRATSGGVYRPRNPRASPLWQCAMRHASKLRAAGRIRRAVEQRVMERFIACGDPHHGFARIYCDSCGHDYLLAFSCKTRYFCPSCHQKRVLLAEDFRYAVLGFLVGKGAVSGDLRRKLPGARSYPATRLSGSPSCMRTV
jgi:transposase-like zinc-binding protein